MSSDCIFCKIVAGQIPAAKVYEDDHVLAFRDIQPQAPVHLLVIPRRHLASAHDLQEGDGDLLGRIFHAIRTVAEAEGIAQSGYRVLTNVGRDSGQVVFHLHFHVMGGKPLGPLG